jgi:hypothetical protein
MSLVAWIFRHNSDLNYKWILGFYVIASLASIVLFCVEKFGAQPQIKFISNLNGFHMVFVPYIPCLLWTLTTLHLHNKRILKPSTTIEKKDL